MQFNGTYDQMQDFLLRMRNLARLVAVTDVSYCRVPVIDDEHSCPVEPPDPVKKRPTLAPGGGVRPAGELQADVYFQPEGVLPVPKPRRRSPRAYHPTAAPRGPAVPLRWVGRRVSDLARARVDTFLRDNRLLPPVLALLALFVFAWVWQAFSSAGPRPDRSRTGPRSPRRTAQNTDPAAPEVDNPNVDSCAAYRSKDPFRQVFAVAQTTPEGTASPPEQTTTGQGRRNGDRPANGGNRRARDTDGDVRPTARRRDGLDPNNPDTDGDGIPDGLDDASGDGVPDGASGGPAAGE